MGHRRWQELSRSQRTIVLVVAPVEIALTAAAAADLVRRPRDQIRGPKGLWWLGTFVQPFGPVAYLGGGRRADPTRHSA
jgi:hypothetical protein